MAVGKAKGKKGKGGKRKAVDPMSRKEWYDVVAPACFEKDRRSFAKTLVNKTVALKRSEDNLKGRVFEVNLADLQKDETRGYRKMLFRVDHVVGRNCITNFHGMSLTMDKLRQLVKKKCSLVEARSVVTTSDGYMLSIFLIGFSARQSNQAKRNSYAQASQLRAVRKRMVDHTRSVLGKQDLQSCVKKFTTELPAGEMARECHDIFPMKDIFIRKVKILKAPKFDVQKLMDAHGNDLPPSLEGSSAAVE